MGHSISNQPKIKKVTPPDVKFGEVRVLIQCSKSRHGTLGIFAFSMCLE